MLYLVPSDEVVGSSVLLFPRSSSVGKFRADLLPRVQELAHLKHFFVFVSVTNPFICTMLTQGA